MRFTSLALLLPALIAGAAHAQLYKWVDKDGQVTYSDVPPPKDAKDVKQKTYGDNVTTTEADTPYLVKDAMQRNPVALYANACGDPCDKARALLSTRGVPFADRNPETNKAARDALNEAVGSLSVPTLTVGTRVLTGFSENEWQEALSSAGYPRFSTGIRAATAAKPTTPAAATPPPAAPAPPPPPPAARYK